MNRRSASRRGQPLMVYALLIVGWIGVRSLFWASPLVDPLAADSGTEAIEAARSDGLSTSRSGTTDSLAEEQDTPLPPASGPWRSQEDWRLVEPVQRDLLQPVAYGGEQAALEFSDGGVAAGHQLMWMAAMAHFPVPKALVHEDTRQVAAAPNAWLPLAKSRGLKRWSLDAWVFLREGSGASLGQSGVRPSYGRSQQGAVLRYRLAEAGGREPNLYARYTRALAGVSETDLAAGIEVRPFAALPLRLHAEMRARIDGGRTDWRPAAFVTAGVHEQLGRSTVLRGYGQAGYVGGNFATAFVDGQLVADREVAKFDLGKLGQGKLHLGAGAWAAAQKGAERVDIGPSANVVVPVGAAPVRLQVDYRFRVAGDAEPDSGMALTLSTGF